MNPVLHRQVYALIRKWQEEAAALRKARYTAATDHYAAMAQAKTLEQSARELSQTLSKYAGL